MEKEVLITSPATETCGKQTIEKREKSQAHFAFTFLRQVWYGTACYNKDIQDME